MQAFLSGLVLAGVSGVTFLAFRHARAYARLFPYLLLIASVIFLVLSTWQVAVRITWTSARVFVDPEIMPAANLAVAALQVPYFWVCMAYIGALVFLWINAKLPPFINASEGRSDAVRTLED